MGTHKQGNSARVEWTLKRRSSGAAGVHKQARRPVRSQDRRRSIEESRRAG